LAIDGILYPHPFCAGKDGSAVCKNRSGGETASPPIAALIKVPDLAVNDAGDLRPKVGGQIYPASDI
jgi:hypothetical protein